ncbi:NAD-dependent epimerase/dehydratase family protein [Candidatus Kaiserbacteria bacterium]|nr:NAD-dependent epimerase/dehydratase family protein [Candidatus Kaiserbacteria bacterium]
MHTYAIIGGAGFIGTNLSERLVAEEKRVIVIDDLSAGDHRDRLPKEVEFHQEDMRNTEAVTALLANVDVVVLLAALPRVQFSIQYPRETHDVNVNGILSVLEAARAARVSRVVYAASSSAYGDQETLPLSEDLPAQPKSPYALQKYIGEQYMKLWSSIYGLKTVSLRFFNVYGKHMDPEGAYALVVGKFLKARKEGKPLPITGDGEQTRDFTHVRDTVDAVVRAAESEVVGHGEVFNVGAGDNVSINELARLIGGEVEYVEARLEPKHTKADNSKIHEVLGWQPTVVFADGITELKVEWGIAE